MKKSNDLIKETMENVILRSQIHEGDLAELNKHRALDITIHELKILPEYYKAVVDGSKKFEIRKNDRGFKLGDVVVLREFCGKDFVGSNPIIKTITYITDYNQKKDYVVFSIE